MKRFLSWVVLLVCNKAAEIIATLFAFVVLWVWGKLLDAGILAIVIAAVLAGGTGLSLAIFLPMLGSAGAAWLSQRVYKSKVGRRYTVVAVVYGIIYGAALFGAIITLINGDISVESALMEIIGYALLIYFEIMLGINGRERVAEDGAPLTKKQRLEARLAKEQEREEKAAAIEAVKEMERK